MKIALDPFMLRKLPIFDVVRIASEIGYRYIEPSFRTDFLPLFVAPRANKEQMNGLKKSLRQFDVGLASLPVVYRWASTDEEERIAAIRYWKKAIEVAVTMECPVMNTEFSGRPEKAEASEAAFWKSIDELLPVFEREGITVHIEPHPDDFIEDGNSAVDVIRSIGSDNIKYLYCAPHTFHMGGDIVGMLEHAAPVLAHVHVADSFDHRASSGLRYIVNPLGSKVRVHQHLNIGEGEIDWPLFFSTIKEIEFDGIMTTSVFGWEEKALESAAFMLQQIKAYLYEDTQEVSR